MRQYGVQTDDGRFGPCVTFELQAENLVTAWMLAHRVLPHGRRPMVVFSADEGRFEQAMRLDYSSTTGTGDPH